MLVKKLNLRYLDNFFLKNNLINLKRTYTIGISQDENFSVVSNSDLPLRIERNLKNINQINTNLKPIPETWLENFNVSDPKKLSILKLNPKVFSNFPRTDIIYKNIKWQKDIHWFNNLSMRTKNELSDSTKKPWPQKKTGRARHGSKRSAQWKHGEWVFGPRGPMTKYYLLSYFERIQGLTSVLSCKFAQNDIKIVKDVESFNSNNPEDLEKALEVRRWGPTALIVDSKDIFPKNLALAAHTIGHINLIPLYGLNVDSMLKHETLILTLSALNELEEKILFNLNRIDLKNVIYKHEPMKIIPEETPEFEGVKWPSNLHKDDWI